MTEPVFWAHPADLRSQISAQTKRECHKAEWSHAFTVPLYAHPAPAPAVPVNDFQLRVRAWMLECFGVEISNDRTERNHRFLEESLELVQSLGCTQSEAHQLVDYVFNRPVGEPTQEVGGVMVTLAALCLANSMDMAACGEVELNRIWGKVEQIRAKQAAKPKHSPLPEHPAPAPAEHTAADAPSGDRGVKDARPAPSAAGVPDVAVLIERARSKTYSEGPDEIYYNLPNLHDELADALEIVEGENRVMRQREQTMLERQATAIAALQSQLADSKRSEMWLGNDNDSWKIAHAQQAERIKELEALSVTHILLDVVPGERGEGEEIYAKSVSEVEEALTKLGLQVEDLTGDKVSLQAKLAEAVRLIELSTAKATSDKIATLTAELEEAKAKAEELGRQNYRLIQELADAVDAAREW